eukprot:TRINITY_DN1003_c1_g1_i1.p1 TRINITY_DN1003_c1_g1~~TRINITY_DN1003_c1_g1_i1.p1  ORF type:complete len:281 (-),score=127.99 TRINITY_DN1003_c1_g1_i1:73-915(-)
MSAIQHRAYGVVPFFIVPKGGKGIKPLNFSHNTTDFTSDANDQHQSEDQFSVYYLVIRHKRGGHWGFPKGLPIKGETERQTAEREFMEETGINRHSFSFLPTEKVFEEKYLFVKHGRVSQKISSYYLAVVSREGEREKEVESEEEGQLHEAAEKEVPKSKKNKKGDKGEKEKGKKGQEKQKEKEKEKKKAQTIRFPKTHIQEAEILESRWLRSEDVVQILTFETTKNLFKEAEGFLLQYLAAASASASPSSPSSPSLSASSVSASTSLVPFQGPQQHSKL